MASRRSNPPALLDQGDGTLLVPLTQGMFARIDLADSPLVGDAVWHARRRPGSRVMHDAGRAGPLKRVVLMHRVIAAAPLGVLVDHVNGNALDNRRENLRLATHSQNIQNRGRQLNNTSGFVGVHLSRRGGPRPWLAYIKSGGRKARRTHIGCYSTAVEAAAARDAKAAELFGEFAVLNFPGGS